MLRNDETSFGESLLYGLAPIVARSGVIALGAAVDTALGFTTLGFFTLAAVFVTGYLIQKALIEERNRLAEIYRRLEKIVRERQKRALEQINHAVANFLSSFWPSLKVPGYW